MTDMIADGKSNVTDQGRVPRKGLQMKKRMLMLIAYAAGAKTIMEYADAYAAAYADADAKKKAIMKIIADSVELLGL